MAILNVKDFPDKLYEKIKEKAKKERRSIAQEVTHLLNEALKKRKRVSISALRGLGKEIWNNERSSTEDYLKKERDSW